MTRKIGWLIVLFGMGLAAAVPAQAEEKGAPAGQAQAVGAIIKYNGVVYAQRAGAPAPGTRVSDIPFTIFTGDTVVTKLGANAALVLDDGSVIALKENTELALKDKQAGKKRSRIKLLLGRLWAKIKPQDSQLEIETPTAVAAIKGTSVELIIDGKKVTLIVWDGLVEFFNDWGKVLAKASQQSTAESGQAPGQPVNIDLSKLNQWFNNILQSPPSKTLKTKVRNKDGKEFQLDLKYNKQ